MKDDFLEAVDEGLKAIAEGRTRPHEQVVADMERRKAQLRDNPE
jgi:predicted transcriptional regulator